MLNFPEQRLLQNQKTLLNHVAEIHSNIRFLLLQILGYDEILSPVFTGF